MSETTTFPTPLDARERTPLGAALRRRRRELELTLKHVAACAGVSISYVSKLETGTREPPPDVLVKLCRCLDLDVRKVARESR